jgi:hypothetical protein
MKIITLSLLLTLSFLTQAKTVLTLTKSSSICSVSFESKYSSKRIDGEKYLKFKISDIKLGDLYMAKGSLESSTSSQWLNTGEKYYISAYINNSIGPKHIPIVIPKRDDDWNSYLDIHIDKYLPCKCFKDSKPTHCQENFVNRFQDKFGNWWQQTGKDTARKVGNKIGEGSHKVWDTSKDGWKNIKDGWNNYKK